MKVTLWWLSAALLGAPALAGDLFDHPRTPAQAQAVLRAAMPDLGQAPVLRGRFSQRKFLREIPRPLTSTGEFLLVRDRGVWWHVQRPLDFALTLTPGGLVPLDAGPPTLSRGSRQQPRPDLAAGIFFALFALDLDALARSFDLFVMESEERWLLGLRPRDAVFTTWFQKATLSGGARVEQVTLFEATGDRTEIDLDVAEEPVSSLTPAERRYFEH